MDIIYRKSEGSQAEKPKAIDTTSSSTVVYLRKNIQQEEREYDGEKVKLWVYDEAILTHDEFEEYMAEVQQEGHAANEDAICELSETTEDSIAALEQAICDLSEEIGG